MTDEGNCWCFSSCFDCFCLGKDWGEGGGLLSDNGVMKWRPWPALSCHPFVFDVGVSLAPRGVKWSLMQQNRSYSVKSADSGSRRTVRTRGSSCRRAPPGCPCVHGEVQKTAAPPWFWRWEGSFIVPTPNAAFASSCDASAAWDHSAARQKKKKKGNRGMRCPSETGPKGARAKCWCTEGDGPKRWPRVRLVGEEMVFLLWHNPTVSCEAG